MVTFGTIKNSAIPTESLKLKVYEYVLEIDNKNITGVTVNYSWANNEEFAYEDGQKKVESNKEILDIELEGHDEEGKEAGISFYIMCDLDYLNSLSNTPTDITKFLKDSEAFIKKPSEEKTKPLSFLFPTNTLEDMHKNLTSLWISKIKDNEFIIKLSVGSEVFTFFKIELKKN